jgi:hypothetical protein
LKKQTEAARAAHQLEKQARHERHMNWFHESQRYKPQKKSSERRKSSRVPVDEIHQKELIEEKHGEDKMEDMKPQSRGREARYRKSSVISQRQGRSGGRYRPHSHSRSRSRSRSSIGTSVYGRAISPSNCSCDTSDSDESIQDIEEVWFPGGHADIGGGWALQEGEVPLSHVPLVWIVREAKKSGCQFDEDKMATLGCLDDSEDDVPPLADMPTIQVTDSPSAEKGMNGGFPGLAKDEDTFRGRIAVGATKGKIHDCLSFGKGLPGTAVLAWKVMEYLPFRRLDLLDDGSWKPIRW